MARHYTTRDFFRQMPNRLLARYFEGRGVLAGLDFAAMKETQTEGLFTAWLKLPDSSSQRRKLEDCVACGRDLSGHVAARRISHRKNHHGRLIGLAWGKW